MDLQAAARDIATRGPHRVLIDASGEATSWRRAREEHGILPDVIFIRGDGWSLGAPEQWRAVAEALWHDEWVGVMERGETEAKPYHQNQHPRTIQAKQL